MPWEVCKCCNTSHLELNDELTLWNDGGDYVLKDKREPSVKYSLSRILKLVM